MKTKLSFETLENKLALSSVSMSLQNCLWKNHHNYTYQKSAQIVVVTHPVVEHSTHSNGHPIK